MFNWMKINYPERPPYYSDHNKPEKLFTEEHDKDDDCDTCRCIGDSCYNFLHGGQDADGVLPKMQGGGERGRGDIVYGGF